MNETVRNILARASVRKFKQQHIPDEDIELIVQCGLKAPSAMNRQTPRFVIIRNQELIQKLSRMNAEVMNSDSDPFYGAPDLVLVLGSKEGKPEQDGPIAVENMLLAAFSMGYGACWINRCREMFETSEGKKLLTDMGINEELVGIACVILGYPDTEFVPKDIIEGRVYYA